MWLVEAMGVDAFRQAIEQRMGQTLRREVSVGGGRGKEVPRGSQLGTAAGKGNVSTTLLDLTTQPGNIAPPHLSSIRCSSPPWSPLQVHVAYDDEWPRRDVLGVHPQQQAGLFWAGACVPAGRVLAADFYALADACEK